MNLLLDSHTLLWLMEANPSLSGRAAALIADPANRLHLSMASIWEIGISYEALPFPDPQHRDPFDRMIATHALPNKLSVVGNDVAFDPYGITRLW